jgi:hypothetical protein
MRKALTLYQYLGPAVLAPASLFLWHREYAGDWPLVISAWLLPVVWAYIVPGVGTNVLKVWEFETRLRLGRFRLQHGFVFGSATALLAWLVHVPAQGPLDVVRAALVMASVLGFWNVLYDVKALEAGILRVYNEPWAAGQPPAAIALDYAPWFFGGFGAVYGGGIGALELLRARDSLTGPLFAGAFAALLTLAIALPVAGFVVQSRRRYGHSGTHPVKSRCRSG